MDGWPILHALWLFLPAYVANMSPVFSSKLMPKWSHPIDGGRTREDGTRLLGDGKTWRGLAGGAVAAGLTALAMAAIAPAWDGSGWLAGWDLSASGYPGGAIGTDPCEGQACVVDTAGTAWYSIFLFGALVGFFALAGDAVESYFKRKSGRPRGAPWIPFDQLDFVVFGILGMLAGSFLLADGWVMEALFGHWLILTTLLVLTPGLHLLVNRVGYWIGLKDVPW